MNQKKTVLTIIVPSFNMEKFLPRCLSSLVVNAEHMKMFEVLVVNDGSSDRTSEIAHRYSELYPDVFRVIDKQNGHYGSCVNEGLKQAEGTFVKILDADDAFDSIVFSRFLDFLSKEPVLQTADLVLTGYCEVTEAGEVYKQVQFHNYDGPFRLGDLVAEDRCKWFIHGLTYRRENLKKNQYIQSEGLPYTDHEWAFVPLTAVNTIFSFDGILYRYSVGRDGQSVDPEQHAKNLSMEVKVIESMLRHYDKMTKMEDMSDQLFIEEQLQGNVENIYLMYLMWLSRYVTSMDPLKKFDSFLLEKYPEIYSRTNLFRTRIAGIGFHTIKNWRAGRMNMVKAQNMLYRLVDKLNTLRK